MVQIDFETLPGEWLENWASFVRLLEWNDETIGPDGRLLYARRPAESGQRAASARRGQRESKHALVVTRRDGQKWPREGGGLSSDSCRCRTSDQIFLEHAQAPASDHCRPHPHPVRSHCPPRSGSSSPVDGRQFEISAA